MIFIDPMTCWKIRSFCNMYGVDVEIDCPAAADHIVVRYIYAACRYPYKKCERVITRDELSACQCGDDFVQIIRERYLQKGIAI